MSDNDSLSKKNVRVHLSEVPDFFSPKLKKFLTSQPDFNDEIQKLISANAKALELLSQSLADAEKARQSNALTAAQTITRLEHRLAVLEGKPWG